MLDAGNKRTYVKFHFKTAQGIRNFTNDEAAQMKA
jgi:catalase